MGLYKKMHDIMNESKALEKDLNVAGQYKAISEATVLNEIKPLLKKHGVIIFPVESTATQEGKITQITAKYKIVDVESGESETLATVGNGADSQDKGSGKAWTYAYKCLLQKTFCLFSGEDTDNTNSDDIEKNITTAMLQEAMNKKGITVEQVIKTYKEETGKDCTDLKFITQDKKQEYYERMNK